MTGLADYLGRPPSGGRRFGLHHHDRPTTLSRHKPQPRIDDAQEVTGEGAAGWTVGRDHLRQEVSWVSSRALRQCAEHPPKEQGRFLACHILIKETRQRVQQDPPAR
jgi:hypothetical protein